jgi:hypothetical protein
MKTHTHLNLSRKTLLLLAAIGLAGTALAAPAMAHGNRYSPAPMYNSGNHNNGNMYRQRDQYAWLNRINRYGVRGKIIRQGQGQLYGCFRVKRTGRYQREAAIVTVRYCKDGYGQPYMVRGTKRLVRYLAPYRQANHHGYRNSMRY